MVTNLFDIMKAAIPYRIFLPDTDGMTARCIRFKPDDLTDFPLDIRKT